MQLASSARIPDGFMAAMRLGGEKPHQGLPGRNPALYQGPTVSNSTTALGLQAAAVLNRIGSCSTGKEHDTESGNDYFEARYYASSMGRFMSPDWSAKEDPVPYAQMDDPQSLNLYSYVRNNPLSKTDPDGHCPFCIPALAVVGGGALEGGEVGAVAGPPGIVVGVVVGAVIGGGILAYEHFHEDAPAPAATPAPTATPTPDFVVTPGGTAVSTDPNRVAGSLTGAPGVTSTPTTQSGEQGTLHTGVQTANGPVDVRTMSGSKTNAPRTVITHPGTNNPKTPDGKATNDKGQSHIPSNSKIPQPPKTPQNP